MLGKPRIVIAAVLILLLGVPIGARGADTTIQDAVNALVDYRFPVCLRRSIFCNGLGCHCEEYRYDPAHKIFEGFGVRAFDALANAIENDDRPLKHHPGQVVADVALTFANEHLHRAGGRCTRYPLVRNQKQQLLSTEARQKIAKRVRADSAVLPFRNDLDCRERLVLNETVPASERLGVLRQDRNGGFRSSAPAGEPDVKFSLEIHRRALLVTYHETLPPEVRASLLAQIAPLVSSLSRQSRNDGELVADLYWNEIEPHIRNAVSTKQKPAGNQFSLIASRLLTASSKIRDPKAVALYAELLELSDTISLQPADPAGIPMVLSPFLESGEVGYKILNRLFRSGKLFPADPILGAHQVLNHEVLFALGELDAFRELLVKGLESEVEVAGSPNVKIEYLSAGGPYPFAYFQFGLNLAENSYYLIRVESPVDVRDYSTEELVEAGFVGNLRFPQANVKPPRGFAWGDLYANRLAYLFPELGTCPPYAPTSERRRCRNALAKRLLSTTPLRYYSPALTEQCERGFMIIGCERLVPREKWPTPIPYSGPLQSRGFHQSVEPVESLGGMVSRDMSNTAQLVSSLMKEAERLKAAGRNRDAEEFLRLKLQDTSLLGPNAANLRGQLVMLLSERGEWGGAYRELQILWDEVSKVVDLKPLQETRVEMDRLAAQGKLKEAVERGTAALAARFSQ